MGARTTVEVGNKMGTGPWPVQTVARGLLWLCLRRRPALALQSRALSHPRATNPCPTRQHATVSLPDGIFAGGCCVLWLVDGWYRCAGMIA